MKILVELMVMFGLGALFRLWTIEEDEDAKNEERRAKGAPVPCSEESERGER